MEATEDTPPRKNHMCSLVFESCLRIFSVAASLAATWMMMTSKQSVELMGLTLDARYNYAPAFKFFAIGNAVASGLSLLSFFLLFIMCRRCTKPGSYFYMFLQDLVTMSLLLASCASATAIGYLGKYGNTHTGWSPICDYFGKFCHRVTISVAFSYLAFLPMLILTVLSASKSRHTVA